jgi:hypothetical protein
MVKFPPAVNLLPENVKESFTRRYYFSLASLFIFLIAVAAAAGVALLMPSYLVAKDSEVAYERILDSTEKNLGLKEKDGANAGVIELAERVKILAAYAYRPAVMPILAAIGQNVSKEISVKSIKIKEVESGKGTATVAGIATTRASLLGFANALKAERIFLSVSVPVEQLAGEMDIEFSLTFPYELP